jgi:hypothetical protein
LTKSPLPGCVFILLTLTLAVFRFAWCGNVTGSRSSKAFIVSYGDSPRRDACFYLLSLMLLAKRNPERYFCFEKRVNWKRMWKATFTSSCEKCCFITLYSELYKNNIKLYSEFSDLIVLTVWTNLLGFLKDAQPEDAKFTAIYHHMPT